MNDTLGPLLQAIAAKLNGGNALNYSVSFGVFAATGIRHEPIETIVRTALGREAIVGGSNNSTAAEVIAETRMALEFNGDHGSHPNSHYAGSPAHATDVDRTCDEVAELVGSADSLTEIWLKAGHPFYPVFWDFAFVISRDANALVYIGSSSD